MLFTKSIAFDEKDIETVASASSGSCVFGWAETEFVDKLKQGDADAFDLLVTRYSGDLYSLLCRMTNDPDEAGDLMQETFLSAIKAIKGFRGDSGIKTWLFRIAINHARNRFRWWNRRQRNNSVSLDAVDERNETPLVERIAGNEIDPENAAIQSEREKAVVAELAKLPDIYREAIILCDIEDLSYQEIASSLEINIGTVKSRLARGREELRKRLQDF